MLSSAAALLNGLFEHPEAIQFPIPCGKSTRIYRAYPQPAEVWELCFITWEGRKLLEGERRVARWSPVLAQRAASEDHQAPSPPRSASKKGTWSLPPTLPRPARCASKGSHRAASTSERVDLGGAVPGSAAPLLTVRCRIYYGLIARIDCRRVARLTTRNWSEPAIDRS